MTGWGDLYKLDNQPIDWTKNRIRPRVEFKVPDEFKQMEFYEEETFFVQNNMANSYDVKKSETEITSNGWIGYPLGVFLVATPKKKEEGSSISRVIEGYDKLLIVKEDKLVERLTFQAGTTYYDCMTKVLESAGVTKYTIENDGKKLATDKEYEPGEEKLKVLNDLASELNFTQLWVDEYGYFRSERYVSPSEKGLDYEYKDDELSIIMQGMEEELDVYDLPNVFHVTVSNPDKDEVLTATYENNNRDHPRSIPNLGRRIVRYEEKEDIADQEVLDNYVERIALESSQIFGKVMFDTAIMPFHGYSNILRVRNQTLGIDEKYSETDWSIPLESGGSMSHEVRRVVKL
ncbi:hypothetical protein [Halobacillus sp. Cin3]|uniref:hypothetical protein n=1 Tax=Halobacillus sp. Cin3 TaxID=2928441 RepID=UPI00248EA4B3|nr:hypothetical protein [Halobacillus sp. Cin3]